MGAEAKDVLQGVTGSTNSELILFFVVAAVILVIFLLPLYGIIVKDRRERRKAEYERTRGEAAAISAQQSKAMEHERQILDVVTSNTQVMASLRTTLERDGKATIASIDRVHTRIDHIGEELGEQSNVLVKLHDMMGEAIRASTAIETDVRSILYDRSK